jgi:hypothetical protein
MTDLLEALLLGLALALVFAAVAKADEPPLGRATASLASESSIGRPAPPRAAEAAWNLPATRPSRRSDDGLRPAIPGAFGSAGLVGRRGPA